MADFQKKTFNLLAPSLHAVRDGTMPSRRRFWIERTKKAGKDSDLACCLLWLMAFPKRPILVQVCAADQSQAGIIKRRAAELVYLNPWIGDRLTLQQNRILGHKRLGEVVIEATDASGGAAHGETPDLLILNELVHVAKWRTMEAHLNNLAGVPRGVGIISTNAGIRGTKAEVWRKEAMEDTRRWSMQVWRGKAPWVSQRDVDEAKRLDPIGSEHSRLWRGVWVSGAGGAVEEEAINRCFRLSGPLPGPEKGWEYVAGLDLGVSHDHAGLVVLGINRSEQRIKVACVSAWEPDTPNDSGQLEVDSEKVERECRRLSRLFSIQWFGYDPAAGGSFMAQRLRKRGIFMTELFFTVGNLTSMAQSFVQAIKGGKLECFEDEDGRLRRDFGKFDIEHKPPSNYKLVAVSDEYGHADVGTALVICLPRAMDMLGGWDAELDDDVVLVSAEDPELSEREIDEMPDELRGICESVDDLAGFSEFL
jgi:hypothetical protein